MAETNNFNLYKPAVGESGWAQALNNSFDIIDSQMKSNQDSISGHAGTGTNKHSASQIRTSNGSNVESEIASLISGKADTNHNHSYAEVHHSHTADEIAMPDGGDVSQTISAIYSNIGEIENTLNLLNPDLTNITIIAYIDNRPNGLRILCNVSPLINITNWQIDIKKNGSTIVEVNSSSSYNFVHEDSLDGVQNGDVLGIIITAFSGQSSKSRTYSHTYQHINSNIEERINAVESQLTIGNIIDSFAQDSDALQALANVLHSSNTLAQKVAELS